MMGEISQKVDIAGVLKAIGVGHVVKADPLDLKAAVAAVKDAAAVKGVSAVIFESPCIAVTKPGPTYAVDVQRCTAASGVSGNWDARRWCWKTTR